jgi:hypothetical protein
MAQMRLSSVSINLHDTGRANESGEPSEMSFSGAAQAPELALELQDLLGDAISRPTINNADVYGAIQSTE